MKNKLLLILLLLSFSYCLNAQDLSDEQIIQAVQNFENNTNINNVKIHYFDYFDYYNVDFGRREWHVDNSTNSVIGYVDLDLLSYDTDYSNQTPIALQNCLNIEN